MVALNLVDAGGCHFAENRLTVHVFTMVLILSANITMLETISLSRFPLTSMPRMNSPFTLRLSMDKALRYWKDKQTAPKLSMGTDTRRLLA